MPEHSYSHPGADPPGYPHISVASLRVGPVLLIGQGKKPLNSLPGDLSGLECILSSSHPRGQGCHGIKRISTRRYNRCSMQKKPLTIVPEMEEYIRSKTSDQRIATTCEGPLIFSVKISPSKPTDLVIQVGERKLYVSALQAPLIKVVDSRLLPRCALLKMGKR
jgi:hypothetical protein